MRSLRSVGSVMLSLVKLGGVSLARRTKLFRRSSPLVKKKKKNGKPNKKKSWDELKHVCFFEKTHNHKCCVNSLCKAPFFVFLWNYMYTRFQDNSGCGHQCSEGSLSFGLHAKNINKHLPNSWTSTPITHTLGLDIYTKLWTIITAYKTWQKQHTDENWMMFQQKTVRTIGIASCQSDVGTVVTTDGASMYHFVAQDMEEESQPSDKQTWIVKITHV